MLALPGTLWQTHRLSPFLHRRSWHLARRRDFMIAMATERKAERPLFGGAEPEWPSPDECRAHSRRKHAEDPGGRAERPVAGPEGARRDSEPSRSVGTEPV